MAGVKMSLDLLRRRRNTRWLDLAFLNIHFPRPDSQFVKPCRAVRKKKNLKNTFSQCIEQKSNKHQKTWERP